MAGLYLGSALSHSLFGAKRRWFAPPTFTIGPSPSADSCGPTHGPNLPARAQAGLSSALATISRLQSSSERQTERGLAAATERRDLQRQVRACVRPEGVVLIVSRVLAARCPGAAVAMQFCPCSFFFRNEAQSSHIAGPSHAAFTAGLLTQAPVAPHLLLPLPSACFAPRPLPPAGARRHGGAGGLADVEDQGAAQDDAGDAPWGDDVMGVPYAVAGLPLPPPPSNVACCGVACWGGKGASQLSRHLPGIGGQTAYGARGRGQHKQQHMRVGRHAMPGRGGAAASGTLHTAHSPCPRRSRAGVQGPCAAHTTTATSHHRTVPSGPLQDVCVPNPHWAGV